MNGVKVARRAVLVADLTELLGKMMSVMSFVRIVYQKGHASFTRQLGFHKAMNY